MYPAPYDLTGMRSVHPLLCNPGVYTLRKNVVAQALYFHPHCRSAPLFAGRDGLSTGVEVFSERLNAIPYGTVTVAIETVHIVYTHPFPSLSSAYTRNTLTHVHTRAYLYTIYIFVPTITR
jgi:hypothetical protein